MGTVVVTDGPAEYCCRITLHDALGTAADCESCGQHWEREAGEWRRVEKVGSES